MNFSNFGDDYWNTSPFLLLQDKLISRVLHKMKETISNKKIMCVCVSKVCSGCLRMKKETV